MPYDTNGENWSKAVITAQEVVLPPRNNTVGAGDLDSPYQDNPYGEEITFDESDLPF